MFLDIFIFPPALNIVPVLFFLKHAELLHLSLQSLSFLHIFCPCEFAIVIINYTSLLALAAGVRERITWVPRRREPKE